MMEYPVNWLCKTYMKSYYRDFLKNTAALYEQQKQLLLWIIKKNSSSMYGSLYNFKSIKTINDYQQQVPLVDYEDISPYITRIIRGEKNILTTEEVRLLEPTSGSTEATKLIPYTASLKNEFLQAINCWLYDIYASFPKTLKGKSYWSISPVNDYDRLQSKVPIGFEDDSQYLGLIGSVIKRNFVAGNEVRGIKDMEDFRYVTSLLLVREPNISLLSVWNPTFLLLLLDFINEHKENLIKDIFDGTISVKSQNPFLKTLVQKNGKSRKRARELEKIFCVPVLKEYRKVWKNLALVSCWGDGPAAFYGKQLQEYFPGVQFQFKGLIATEGIISFPLHRAGGNVLAYQSHFFEFLDEQGKIRLAGELEAGEKYRVIMTTGGGLYRYKLGDVIEVQNSFKGLPVFRFLGRDRVTDFFGEKLAEGFIQNLFDTMVSRYDLEPEFMMTACETRQNCGFYVLFLENSFELPENSINRMTAFFEDRLCENYHYKYARSLKQLTKAKIVTVKKGQNKYIGRSLKEGKKMGDIKPAVLDKRTGWLDHFLPS